MRTFFFIVLSAFILAVTTQISAQVSTQSSQTKVSKKKSKIRYDGFYCEQNDDGRTCLRFYEDGLVLALALDAEVTDEDLVTNVPEWFRRDSDKSFSRGKYKAGKSKISFSTLQDSPNVKIDYKGSIEESGGVIVLDTYSHFNGNRQQARRFEFVQMLK